MLNRLKTTMPFKNVLNFNSPCVSRPILESIDEGSSPLEGITSMEVLKKRKVRKQEDTQENIDIGKLPRRDVESRAAS